MATAEVNRRRFRINTPIADYVKCKVRQSDANDWIFYVMENDTERYLATLVRYDSVGTYRISSVFSDYSTMDSETGPNPLIKYPSVEDALKALSEWYETKFVLVNRENACHTQSRDTVSSAI